MYEINSLDNSVFACSSLILRIST